MQMIRAPARIIADAGIRHRDSWAGGMLVGCWWHAGGGFPPQLHKKKIRMPFIGIKKCRKMRTLRRGSTCLQHIACSSDANFCKPRHNGRCWDFHHGSIAAPGTATTASCSSPAVPQELHFPGLNSDLPHDLALNSESADWLIHPLSWTLLPIAQCFIRHPFRSMTSRFAEPHREPIGMTGFPCLLSARNITDRQEQGEIV